jgi:hypothetical protein
VAGAGTCEAETGHYEQGNVLWFFFIIIISSSSNIIVISMTIVSL